MWASLYNSENEQYEDFPNSTTLSSVVNSTGRKIFAYDDDTSKDEANPDFWEAEFGEIGPGVTTTPYDPQLSTGNSSMEGTSYLCPAPTNMVGITVSSLRRVRLWIGWRLPPLLLCVLHDITNFEFVVECDDVVLPKKGLKLIQYNF